MGIGTGSRLASTFSVVGLDIKTGGRNTLILIGTFSEEGKEPRLIRETTGSPGRDSGCSTLSLFLRDCDPSGGTESESFYLKPSSSRTSTVHCRHPAEVEEG